MPSVVGSCFETRSRLFVGPLEVSKAIYSGHVNWVGPNLELRTTFPLLVRHTVSSRVGGNINSNIHKNSICYEDRQRVEDAPSLHLAAKT